MQKLDRDRIPVPSCLVAPEEGWSYGDLGGQDKAEIRAALVAIQRECCAYCERRTGTGPKDGHIEHFRKQASNPTLRLAWSNLFWSCLDEHTCGKHKDKCDRPVGSGPQAKFDIDDLIDPSVQDPHDFLIFLIDGTIRPREGLSLADERRALETIRVFQLADSPFLRKSREDAAKPYVAAVDSLLQAGLDTLKRYLQSIQADIDSAPFSSAIRQHLKGFLD